MARHRLLLGGVVRLVRSSGPTTPIDASTAGYCWPACRRSRGSRWRAILEAVVDLLEVVHVEDGSAPAAARRRRPSRAFLRAHDTHRRIYGWLLLAGLPPVARQQVASH